MLELIHVESGPLIETVHQLLVEYGDSLNFSLCFQSFDEELRSLPGIYAPPRGKLVLARLDSKPAGCIALKPAGDLVCEMKRLYVRPEFRGHNLGRKLTTHLLNEARQIGYRFMRPDTIPGRMDKAISLYRELGFKEIPAYDDNPVPGALYMELDLRHADVD